MKKVMAVLLFFSSLFVLINPSLAYPQKDLENLPEVILNVPENMVHAQYLGLAGEAGSPFKLSEIDADILFVELFSMYCPYCQKAAPKVNELYELLEKAQKADFKLKIIGIGANNTELEVEVFGEEFDIKFPLFSDKDLSIYKALAGEGTPTFIGCKKDGDSIDAIFFRKSGGFADPEEFLENVLKQSQQKK